MLLGEDLRGPRGALIQSLETVFQEVTQKSPLSITNPQMVLGKSMHRKEIWELNNLAAQWLKKKQF